MKSKPWKTYIFWIALSEAVGALAGWLTRTGSELFSQTATKPPLSPPDIVFPIVWGILYALMGISAARIRLAPESPQQRRSISVFFAQLALNFLWTLIFFNSQIYGLAFVCLVALWVVVAVMILNFKKVDRPAAYLQLPYLLWLTFAAYLNFGVWYLN